MVKQALPLLGAVVYARGAPLEEVLAAVRDRLAATRRELRLGGVVPRLGPPLSNGRSSLLLDDIGSGETIVISQDLGPVSTSCILDADGLAKARVRIARAIEAMPHLMFFGRFAREEAAGRGIREEIGQAVIAGIPSLVAVEERTIEAWHEFSGGEFAALPVEVEAILAWVEGLYPRPPASAGG